MRNCPYCEEQIEDDAFFCPHCGRETALESTPGPEDAIDASSDGDTKPKPASTNDKPDRNKTLLVLGLIAIPIVLCAVCSLCFVATNILAIIGDTTGGAGYSHILSTQDLIVIQKELHRP